MSWLVALLLASFGTFALRSGSVRAFEARAMSPVATRMLRHAALAVLASLAVTNLPSASASAPILLPELAGLTAGVLAARRTPNLTAIMAVGIAVYATTSSVIG